MERNIVDGVNETRSSIRRSGVFSMTLHTARTSTGWTGMNGEGRTNFEGEIRGNEFIVHMLNSDSPLDTTNRITRRIGKTSDNSRLESQWTKNRFVRFCRLGKIEDLNMPIGGTDDQKRVGDVHCCGGRSARRSGDIRESTDCIIVPATRPTQRR